MDFWFNVSLLCSVLLLCVVGPFLSPFFAATNELDFDPRKDGRKGRKDGRRGPLTRNCSRVPRLLSAAMRCGGGGGCVPNITKLDCCIVRSVCAWTDADDVARAHVADLIDVLSFGVATRRKSERAEGAHLRSASVRSSMYVRRSVKRLNRSRRRRRAGQGRLAAVSGSVGRDPLQPERILLHCELRLPRRRRSDTRGGASAENK